MDWNELQSLTWPGYARKNGGNRFGCSNCFAYFCKNH